MKKDIFINISIITTQIFFRITRVVESIDFVSIIPILAYIAAIIHVKHIFILREYRIEKQRRTLLYVLIVLCYIIIIASICASYFHKDVIHFVLENAFTTVYIILIVIYFKEIFERINKD